MAKVLVVGDIITDIIAVQSGPVAVGSDTPTAITLAGGGSAANTAAWLASLSVPVSLAGVVGADAAGADRLAELTEAGVDCSAIRREPSAVTGSIIVLAQEHERSFLCDRAANSLLAVSDVDKAAADGVEHVHLSGYTLFDDACRPAGLHALRRDGITTSVDASSAAPLRRFGGARFLDLVRGVDILFANLDEARTLLSSPSDLAAGPDALWSSPGAAAAPADLALALTQHATHAIVKLGADGAVWAGPDGTAFAPALTPAAVVDPTGAGDAFAAGFIAEWLAGAEPTVALAEATRLGALAVATIGARPPR